MPDLALKNLDDEIAETLRKVLEGKNLQRSDAYRLIKSEGEEAKAIMLMAGVVRDLSKGKRVSFSKKVFVPLTNMCRNRCGYCGFRKEPKHPEARLMAPSQVLKMARLGKKAGCKEVLFSLGEKPEEAYPEVRERLRRLGYNATVDYLRDICDAVLKMGLFPHSNPGVLTKDELANLREVNLSMGLMLENVSERLLKKGGPHEFSPGKDPKLRLATMEHAGRLKIAFTTGLLIGIGETLDERVDSLFAIKELNDRYGHVQEVIIQGFKAKVGTPMEKYREPSAWEVALTVAIARLIFKGSVNVQTPPNLLPRFYRLLLFAGINDWGGVSPVTKDFINPNHPWPHLDELRRKTEESGFELRERLPMYPEYILSENGFVPEPLRDMVMSMIDQDGYVRG